MQDFNDAAMEVFRFQSRECPPYRDYLNAVGIEPATVKNAAGIPFLPIGFFKTHRVYCGAAEPETVFTSSSTSGLGESKHYVASAADYERTYTRGFELFYGPAAEWSIYALLPSYLEREGSSLVRMADGLIREGRGGGRNADGGFNDKGKGKGKGILQSSGTAPPSSQNQTRGGFYLYNHDKLMRDMASDDGKKILLGVSYALLDLAEREQKLPSGSVVMETGGMKGRREEMPKAKMHEVLSGAFGVQEIHSEYGMAELMSQAYSPGGGVFRTPPWMRVSVRDLSDPFDVRASGRGGLNITDLANLSSCAFIQTQDVGTVAADGGFTVDGRIARADIRGCNLLVQ